MRSTVRSTFLAMYTVSALAPCAAIAQAAAGNLEGPPPANSTGTAPDVGGGEATLQEVTVTAQRRKEQLQDVPIAIAAFNQNQLASAGVASLGDIGVMAPSFDFSTQTGWAQPRLRGVGTSATGPGLESPVAVYVDGVYYAAMAAGDVPMNNVAGVEVDNGPQGTLFGRNATGGAIQVDTKTPSHDFGGDVEIGYGNYQTTNASAYLTGGITDGIAADVSVLFDNQGQGWGRNVYTGAEVAYTNELDLRSKWLITPTDKLSITISGDVERSQGKPAWGPAPGGSAPLGGEPYPPPPNSTFGYFNPYLLIKQGGGSVTLDYDLDFARFVSITAYRGVIFDNDQDSITPNPAFAATVTIDEPHHQASQELQLVSAPGSSIRWTAGLYYFYEVSGYEPVYLQGPLYFPTTDIVYQTRASTYSAAAYGQATKEVWDRTNLTLGLRYSSERRTINLLNDLYEPDGTDLGPLSATGTKNFDKLTWRVALDHKFSDDAMGYLSYNRGFKSGGFSTVQIPAVSFAPETLDAYELGLKSEFLQHRVRIDSSVYYYNYTNIQVVSYLQNAVPLVYNGASAHLYGLDVDAQARPTDRLRLRTGVSLEKSYFASFPNADVTTAIPGGGTLFSGGSVSGNQIPYAPRLVVDAGGDYVIPSRLGNYTLSVDFTHNSGWYAEADNRLHQGEYNVLNAQFLWTARDGRYEVTLWGKNIANEVYTLFMFSQLQGDAAQYAPPRTFGVTLKTNF